MTDLASGRKIALPSLALGFAVIVGLMVAGFSAVFTHACGYGIALIAALVLASRVEPASAEARLVKRSLLGLGFAVGYAASLLALLVFLDLGLNPYAAQVIAAAVFFFFGACFAFFQAEAATRTKIPEPLAQLVSRAREPTVRFPTLLAVILQLLREPRIGRLLLGCVIFLFAANDLSSIRQFYATVDERAAVPAYARVDAWIDQATCFKKTGVIFALCDQERGLVPAEDATVADDRGHGLLLSLLHGWFDVPASKPALVFVNAIFSALAFGLLTWQFVRLGRIVAAIVFLGLSVRLFSFSFFNSDVFGTFFGLFSLSLLLPLQALRMLAQQRQRLSDWVWLVGSGAALALVILIREPIGLIGCVLTLVALALGLWRRMRNLRIAHVAVAAGSVAAIVLAVNTAGLLTAYRIHYQGVAGGKGVMSHGLAHNLYIGLGSDPNPFGIQWSDASGRNAVYAVDPTIVYGSDKYFETLMALYIDVLRQHPLAVARIYASRIGDVLGPKILPVICLTLAAIVAGLSLARAQGPPSLEDQVMTNFSIVVVAGTLLHAAQAIVTQPALLYYFQASLGLYVLIALACDAWYRVIWSDPRGVSRPVLS